MCDPLTWGLILSATGTGVQAANNYSALNRQDRRAAEGIRRQGDIQRKSNLRVGEQIEDISQSTGEAERAEALSGFQDALRLADDATTGALPDVVGANPRFAEMVQQARSGVRQGAGERAGRLATIDAATLQRLNEGNRMGRTVTDLNELQRRSGAEDFITQLRIAAERPNEWINALGSVLSGTGSALALGTGSLPNFLRGGPNLSKLAKAGTLIDAPSTMNPYAQAARTVFS